MIFTKAIDEHFISGDWSAYFVAERSGDPGLFASNKISGEGILFDLGNLEKVSQKDLLKVSTVMLTHTHMDHFFGFDQLLRSSLAHGKELTFLGPQGIGEALGHRLKAYTWNLIEQSQIRYRIVEILPNADLAYFRLRSSNQFNLEVADAPVCDKKDFVRLFYPGATAPGIFVTHLQDGTAVEAVSLDHGIPSLAYSLKSPLKLSLSALGLVKNNLVAGAWIEELKKMFFQNTQSKEIIIGDRSFEAQTLFADLFIPSSSRPLSYATDFVFSKENIDKLFALSYGVELFVCETNYSLPERELARKNLHLTTYQGALIAACIAADEAINFHFSKKYGSEFRQLIHEFQSLFKQVRKFGRMELDEAIRAELHF